MTDGTRRERSSRIRLVPVDDRVAHDERVGSMKNHPARGAKAGLFLVSSFSEDSREAHRESNQ